MCPNEHSSQVHGGLLDSSLLTSLDGQTPVREDALFYFSKSLTCYRLPNKSLSKRSHLAVPRDAFPAVDWLSGTQQRGGTARWCSARLSTRGLLWAPIQQLTLA